MVSFLTKTYVYPYTSIAKRFLHPEIERTKSASEKMTFGVGKDDLLTCQRHALFKKECMFSHIIFHFFASMPC